MAVRIYDSDGKFMWEMERGQGWELREETILTVDFGASLKTGKLQHKKFNVLDFFKHQGVDHLQVEEI